MGARRNAGLWRNEMAEAYRAMFARRTAEELHALAHVKRFVERYSADPRFRHALSQHADAPAGIARAHGIQIDPLEVLPLFHPEHRACRFTPDEARWPLAKLWDDHLTEVVAWSDRFRDGGACPEANPRFHAWRERQIARCLGELGAFARALPHSVIAFELSAGCSVGCWFCGISAERFQGAFRYTEEHAALWRAILGETAELFGPAAQTGFCYWATDPADNPDYPEFLEDFYHATGCLPQTTTAVPTRDVAFTRRVLRLSEQYRCMSDRFSILSLKAFDAVHAAFTAEELLHVYLLMQYTGSLTPQLATAGRARLHLRKLAATHAGGTPEQWTIACVSGFIVNMVNRTIQLTTPTRASDRWPLGYRIVGHARFATASDFRARIEELIAEHMAEGIGPAAVLRFRPDLTYHHRADGFELHSATGRFGLSGFAGARLLGDLLAEGRMTGGQLQAALAPRGADVFVVADAVQQLFDRALLDDEPGVDRSPEAGREVARAPRPRDHRPAGGAP
jgi:radical SAM family RiPP maturation amino acid epimerase